MINELLRECVRPPRDFPMMDKNAQDPEWIEISVQIDPIAYEALTSFLFDLGCQGLVQEDFGDTTIRAYLPIHDGAKGIRCRLETVLDNLQVIFPEIPPPRLKVREFKDRDWDLNWRRFFHADRVTKKLMVLPPWESPSRGFNGHLIRIDPGLAFGTGKHPTTRMCLQIMEKISFSESWTMLDVGTGSGILAIYGAMLGARRVLATDIDPVAIQWAKRNIELNNLGNQIELTTRPAQEVEGSYSLVTANLVLDVILQLLPHLSRVMEPDGWLILSGILNDQIQKLQSPLHHCALDRVQMKTQGEWACVVARKKPLLRSAPQLE